jgi:threonyl-tRNA synthetase
LVVGDQEIRENKLAIRKRTQGDLGKVSIEEFIQTLREEILAKK